MSLKFPSAFPFFSPSYPTLLPNISANTIFQFIPPPLSLLSWMLVFLSRYSPFLGLTPIGNYVLFGPRLHPSAVLFIPLFGPSWPRRSFSRLSVALTVFFCWKNLPRFSPRLLPPGCRQITPPLKIHSLILGHPSLRILTSLLWTPFGRGSVSSNSLFHKNS